MFRGQVGRDLAETTVTETRLKNKQSEGGTEHIRGQSPVRREHARIKRMLLLLVERDLGQREEMERSIC